ncbi:Trehalose utilization [Rhodobacteraceae bacterium THAF1]|uniref:ThuA domain-containing protein n=1 Tax=Palleronia sp. THAF1 TaxID=2587842 RepID=UPI000F402E47|nr:ThuA domain-containing protein [Palleronia sp. THAF1]QFU07766.1 Trehalose utilization protein [Palleronia sp. THAF1]VDC25581.1 Trehalose utilization [Rhodobacteraceae bacterium THAF1]
MSDPRALIFWGGWDGHDPEACAAVVATMLEEEGMAVTSVQGAEVLRSDDLTDYALIVPMMTQVASDKDGIDKLCAAVRGGVGLGGFHGGMGDAFRDSPAYQFMVGGQWVAHPGDFIDYRIEVTRPDHPLMEGIDSFDYHSEQYFMHVDPGNDVLATTTFTGEHAPEIDGTTMPVFWTRNFGKGRVFYSALGHNSAELAHPQAREVLRRGLIWATATT